MKVKWLYWFWGGMELFYFLRFGYLNFSQERAPFYSDVESYVLLSAEHGVTSGFLFVWSIFLNLSIAITVVLFFAGLRKVPYMVYIQIPLRLIRVVPSLSVYFGFQKLLVRRQ